MDTNLSYFVLSYEGSGTAENGYNLKNVTHENSLDNVLNHPPRPPSAFLQPDDVLDELLSTAGAHNLGETPRSVTQSMSCHICNKSFDKVWKYYGHLRVHSKDNLWLCDKCPDVKYSTKKQLIKHCIETHNEASVKCSYCPMAFDTAWRLQQHILSKHINYRSHKCSQCDKAFVKPSDLKKHQETHSEVKRHACPHCAAKFKDKSNLKRHLSTHSGSKNYVCSSCGHKYQQIASLNRHKKKCISKLSETKSSDTNIKQSQGKTRQNYCRVCGMTFKYKSALLEHCVREHTNPKEDKPKDDRLEEQTNSHDQNTVEDLDEILSADNDYSTIDSNVLASDCDITIFNQIQTQPLDNNPDSLLQIEFLKEMNQLHTLDDELFYNDMMDFDFQPSNFGNDYDYGNPSDANSGILFDLADNGRSMDQDLMNAFLHVKSKDLPDELLNVPEVLIKDAVLPDIKKEKGIDNPVLVNECATIFESDVDLEESSNLAANLNQLIGENNVQYISTEDDDTFIISLNSTIDAEQLTDMLNIGIEYIDENKSDMETKVAQAVETEAKQFEEAKSEKDEGKCKVKKPAAFVCKTCKKKFNKKDNYRSHIATHEPSLRRHVCPVCRERFSYRSTLNKHVRSRHIPHVEQFHTCDICDRQYKAAWLVKNHIERDHEMKTPFSCNVEGCNKKFYKQFDLVIHKRFHNGDRAYECDICNKKFPHASHLKRHVRSTDCTKRLKKNISLKKNAVRKSIVKPNAQLCQIVPASTLIHII